jgi:uncharacterized protein
MPLVGRFVNIDLPRFPYHRDPIAAGSIRHSDAPCECCGEARGALYQGVIYCIPRVKDICPWCIASGAAADKYNATFFDAVFRDDQDNVVHLPEHFYRDVFGCTIGFATFNPISWWVHCGEPAEYVTRVEPYEMVFECRKCGARHSIYDYD